VHGAAEWPEELGEVQASMQLRGQAWAWELQGRTHDVT
jgi:hypothetical protein